MKHKTYRVYFKVGEPETVNAYCKSEAKILAQAERIKKGMFYDVIKIEEVENEK